MKAYRVRIAGFPESLVAARSASKARYATFKSATGAGYRVRFLDVTALRVPQLDEWATGEASEEHCYGDEMLLRLGA